jgi:hypothetical protein
MKLPKEEQYAYNRYMDSLSLKASEIFTLQTEAEFKVREDEKMKNSIEIARNLIFIGIDNEVISKSTGLPIEKIEELIKELKNA